MTGGVVQEQERVLRVGTSVGHGEDTGLGVLVDEVLIGELLTIDGATTGALYQDLVRKEVAGRNRDGEKSTHVVAGEVTTLEHELGDDTVEGGALVALTLRLLAKLTEVGRGLGDVLLVEVEEDATRLGCKKASQSA